MFRPSTKVKKQNLYRVAYVRTSRLASTLPPLFARIRLSVGASTSGRADSLQPFYYDYLTYVVWYVYVCIHAVEEEDAPMSGRRRLMA